MNKRQLQIQLTRVLRQAIEKDPNYALATRDLPIATAFLSGQGLRLPGDVFPLAKQAASKQLRLIVRYPKHTHRWPTLSFIMIGLGRGRAGIQRAITTKSKLCDPASWLCLPF